eukprot:gene22231-28346_t
MHVAAELNLATELIEILKSASSKALVNTSFHLTGQTPLHLAVRSDSADAAALLLSHGASLTDRTIYGMTPLHVAGSVGAVKCWSLLMSAGADPLAADLYNSTPLDWLQRIGWQVDSSNNNRIARRADFEPLSGRTAVVSNPLCSRHFTCPPSATESTSAPPENIKRLEVLISPDKGVLNCSDLSQFLLPIVKNSLAPMSDVLRVHEWSYVRQVQARCEAISSSDPEADSGMAFLDGDTSISKDTFNAALAAAGAVCEAVDVVVAGEVRNAFCPIRPPGHHAGPRGLVKGLAGGPDSHGFCILNNISIGAAYAMNRYRDSVKKVAIVDFDVHHGNGTEETVRWLTPSLEEVPVVNDLCFGNMFAPRFKPWFGEEDAENVLFVSVHGYGPREHGLEHMLPMAAFYPGSGQTVLPPLQALTHDHDSAPPAATLTNEAAAAAASVEGGADGSEEEEAMAMAVAEEEGNSEGSDSDSSDDGDYDGEEEEEDRESSDEDSEGEVQQQQESVPVVSATGQKVAELRRVYSTSSRGGGAQKRPPMKPLILDVGVPLPSESSVTDQSANVAGGRAINELSYRVQWRNYFRTEIFPRLTAFEPDMIFISAGFDAHRRDTINGGYIALIEEDFQWVTDHLVRIANSHCQGRVVSALEGGYQLGGEFHSAFARSVKAHVSSLAQGAQQPDQLFWQQGCDLEGVVEAEFIAKLEAERHEELLRREEARLREVERHDAAIAAAAAAAEINSDELDVTADNSNQDLLIEESLSKKRRRPEVDYIALAKTMRDEMNK